MSRTSLAVSSTMACTAGSDVRAATPLAAWASDRSPPATSRAAMPVETMREKGGKRHLYCRALMLGASCVTPPLLQLPLPRLPLQASSWPRSCTCVILIALGNLPQQLGDGGAHGFGAVAQVLGTFLHLGMTGRLRDSATGGMGKKELEKLLRVSRQFQQRFRAALVRRRLQTSQTLTVSPGKGFSLPSRAAAFTSCRSLSRFCTTLRAESISKGPHAS